MGNLQSQRIDNAKSLYSHPALKEFIEEEEELKRKAAK